MATELKTRIALKYDEYTAWQNSTLELLPGEVAICEIPGTTKTVVNDQGKEVTVQVAPTVLFKVGNAEKKTFKDLPWASAKAADVYTWAKASEITLSEDTKTITFVGGGENGTNLEFSFDFYTTEEIDNKISNINTELAAVKEALGFGEDATALTDRVEDVEAMLAGIGGKDEPATVVAAIAAESAAIKTAYETYADKAEEDAVTAAKAYADEIKTAQATKDAAQDEAIQANAAAIATEAKNRKDADDLIIDKFGAEYDKENTVAKAISEAQTAAEKHADDAITALSTTGAIKAANDAIAKNATDIAANAEAIGKEADKAREEEEKLNTRLEKVEAFFKTTDDQTINEALDTLVEIQEYLGSEDGEATGGLISRVAANEDAIKALQETVGDDETGLVRDAADAKTAIADLQENVETLQGLVEAAQGDATQALADAATAKEAADNAQDDIDALTEVIEAEGTGLGAVKAIADKNKEDIAALTGVVGGTDSGLVKAVADLKAIVVDGDDANDKLRSDITSLQELTADSTNGNTAIRGELDTLKAAVNHETTGLTKTKAIADAAKELAEDNTTRIAALEDANYIKTADFLAGEFIFNCGGAATMTHTTTSIPAPAAE